MYALRDLLVAHISDTANFIEYNNIMRVFEDAYGKVKVIPDGMLLIELTLIRATKRTVLSIAPPAVSTTQTPVQTPPAKKIEPKKEETITQVIEPPKAEEKVAPKVKPIVSSEPKKEETLSPPEKENFSFLTLLHTIKTTKPALVVDLKTARYEVSGSTLKLIFTKNWNYGRVNTPQIKTALSEILDEKF
jgi:hypothetical protein